MPLLSTFGAASARSFGGIGAAAAGAGLDVDEVFSTFLYTGTGSSQTITNGIDLSGEGGLVWIKRRVASSYDHNLFDTERGATKWLKSNDTDAEGTRSTGLSAFNSNGFTEGGSGWTGENDKTYVSWTFRKAPKFFDVVTYSGDGNAGRTVSHNLGSDVGMLIVKRTDAVGEWMVWHKDVAAIDSSYALQLQSTNAAAGYSSSFNSTAPTSTEFTLGNNSKTNNASGTYVAYLFAHNNSDGNFGPDSDQDIIKCGSAPASAATDINLGFEPQLIMIKRTDGTGDWQMYDIMRGLYVVSGPDDRRLKFNSSDAEAGSGSSDYLYPTPTGFHINTNFFGGGPYIYMAIRRGPLAEPTSATDVFEATTSLTGARQNGDTISTTLDYVDWHFARKTDTTYYNYNQARINGWKYLSTNTTDAEASAVLKQGGDQNKLEYTGSWHGAHSSVIDYFFKRAPGFFDVCAYSGTGSARTVSHNLGVVPEMIWIKRRDSTRDWGTGFGSLGWTKRGPALNSNEQAYTVSTWWNDTAPTSSVFTVGSSATVNASSGTYIAYLFATVAGVSKVGSYTSTIDQYGNGTNQTIDCGFTNGARFVLVKRTDGTGDWIVFDSTRGITNNSDPHLRLNQTYAEDSDAYVDIEPHSSGFIVNPGSVHVGGNAQGQTYIFYAIA